MAGKHSPGGQQMLCFDVSDKEPGASSHTLCPPECIPAAPENPPSAAWTDTGQNKPADEPRILSVAELAARICKVIDTPLLTNVLVSGEITGYRPHSSGHMYFSLSEHGDDKATIPCVMWKYAAKTVAFPVKDGILVRAAGYVDYYPPYGKLQFVIKKLEPAVSGKTGLYLQKEAWKKQLTEEGIIPRPENARRDPPLFPTCIGVVTSRTGSVLQDIRNVISRRYPLPVLLAHTAVQGEGAHLQIAAAIASLQNRVDVIIVARGGGSFEDLFEFNHPAVVRAIARSTVPVISAVGHETDTTLSDYAADLRAPTPSAAAETVVPDRAILLRNLEDLRRQIRDRVHTKFTAEQHALTDLSQRVNPARLSRKLDQMHQQTADLGERLNSTMHRKITAERTLCTAMSDRICRGARNIIATARLELQTEKEIILGRNPFKPLDLGYALVWKDGKVIRSAGSIKKDDHLSLKLADGDITTIVESVNDRNT